jgi:hypothetical protein
MNCMKLSELNARLLVVEKKIETLLAGAPPVDPDPELPADLTDTVVRIEAKLAAVTPAP